MKFLIVSLFGLATLVAVSARNVNLEDVIDIEDLTAYGYLSKVGLPLANQIRRAEEEALQSPSRIVGGSLSTLGQFPYQAGLVSDFSGGQGVCGGSLLSTSRVLTAAHCWFDGINQAWRVTVVLGSTTLFFGGTRVSTTNVIMHSGWLPVLIRNDIAMINLPSAITTTDNIAPIALPVGSDLNEDFAGDVAVASGYGRTSDNVGITIFQTLSHVNLTVITNDECRISFPAYIQDSNICTSGANAMSTCRGDSGGPLVVSRNNSSVLIGITSFGSGRGCEVGAPAAFARISSFIDWIDSML